MTRPTMLLCTAAAAGLLALTITPADAVAQTETPTVQSETDRIKAQTELERARADRDRASAERITALGLPSFEGKTTLGENAGAIEATMLTSHAVRAAAAAIADGVGGPAGTGKIIVLAGDEALDFSRIGALTAEMDAIRQLLLRALPGGELSQGAEMLDREAAGAGASAIISAVTAAAGLLRSDTEVAALDLQALSTRVLASMAAAELGERAILPSAAIGSIPEGPSTSDWKQMALMQKLNALIVLRQQVAAAPPKAVKPAKPTKDEQARAARHAAALARFDAFLTRVTTADDKGVLPIVQTARLYQIWQQEPQVLRVYVDKAGGSRVTNKNILTTLGLADPVRISGGLVASYSLTDPSTGVQKAFDLLSCRTTVTRLKSVQRGVWTNLSADPQQSAECEGRKGRYAARR